MTNRLQPASKRLNANGLALNYLEWGEPGALPVVCVHGYTSSAEAFNALARRLQDRAHILAFDVRGPGESAWSPEGAYGYADQAADLAAFVDALVPQPFVLIGTSMGGIIAMAYAAGHKARLKRGELVAVPAVGHAPTLVEPAALAAIERFIAAV